MKFKSNVEIMRVLEVVHSLLLHMCACRGHEIAFRVVRVPVEAMIVLLEVMRVLVEFLIVLVEAVSMLAKAMKGL